MTILLRDAYLCPGGPLGSPHVTSCSAQCDCGNTNLASLANILERPSNSQHVYGPDNNSYMRGNYHARYQAKTTRR